MQNTKLENVFAEIQKKSGFILFYNNEQIDLKKTVSIKANNATITEILNTVLSGEYDYKIDGKYILISKLTQPRKVMEDERSLTVRGVVMEKREPPVPLPGVNITVKGTTIGSLTDADGFYTIKAKKGDILIFKILGFQIYEFEVIKSETNLIIPLQEQISTLDEVVITGMTEQQKKHIASAVSLLPIESNLAGKPITSISQSLQGGITGLNVTQGSGLPGGDAAAIKIRGISTLGNSDPLVLVDGIPMDMNHIDPSTIESVSVLKDAAAAAIYGSRAANGVIAITTKRGKVGRVVLTYDGYFGMQSPVYMPKTVDAVQYMRMYNEASRNAGNAELYREDGEIAKTLSGEDPVRYPDTDWVDLIISKNNPITSHSLGVSGGNNLARFAVTANYLYQDGMIPHTSYDRFTIRANTTINLASKFTVNLDAMAIRLNLQRPNRTTSGDGNRILEDIYRVPPTVLPKYPDNGSGKIIYGRWVDIVNPLAYAEIGGREDIENIQSTINIQPRWNVFDNLNLKGQFFIRLNSDRQRRKRDVFNFFDYETGNHLQTWQQERVSSQARTFYQSLGLSGDYSKSFGKNYLMGIIGYNQEEYNAGEWEVRTLASGYAKFNYAYDDRYLLELVGRIDGSSRFGPGKKFGTFPSIAAGWNIHNESFMKNIKFVNNLKYRISYGKLGNENIGLYRYQSLIDNNNGEERSLGNPDITWETVNMFDTGLDISILDNKLELVLDYYDKLTENIILEPQVSYVAGFYGNAPINSGEVRNRGFEVSLNYYGKIKDNWNISVSPGFSYNKNTIEKLYGNEDIYTDSNTINRVGYPIGSIWGYETDGLLKQSDFDASGNPLVPVMANAKPGDIRYLDRNNNGEIDDGDKSVIGNPVPRINYFANIKVGYKNFDLEALFQGVGKCNVVLSGMFAFPLDMTADGGVPTRFFADNYWTEGRTDARFPRLSTSPSVNKHVSDFWFQDGSFLRTKYIQLGYNFDKDIISKAGLSFARMYINVQNPFTFTGMKLLDPETRGSQWTYGIQRIYTIGVNLKF
ncbi:TonB-dependent receptor [Prevotella sp. 10(H)]|uniref:TonB-dependent receptor n=1 Tax=Prevotella sp. 10(H) TaxID=1158294 RepID=UPI000A8BC796|nr:TonB-dependent receptor [Prevotella sp. 10(H)]